jgi:hypothetical protein
LGGGLFDRRFGSRGSRDLRLVGAEGLQDEVAAGHRLAARRGPLQLGAQQSTRRRGQLPEVRTQFFEGLLPSHPQLGTKAR